MVNRLDAASRRLATSERAVSATLNRLSSGRRIVSAADDAAGLAIAERMRGEGNGALRAQRNVQDGIGAIQTADAILGEVTSILQRTRELAVQYANGSLSATDRAAAQREADALGDEVARLGASARFNGAPLLAGGTLGVHVGPRDGDAIAAALPDLAQFVGEAVFSLDGSGISTTTYVTTTTGGGGGSSNAGGNGNGNAGGNGNGNGNAGGNGSGHGGAVRTVVTPVITFTAPPGPPIARLDAAIGAISEHRASLGAFQNRLEHTLSTLATQHEQMVAAESRIRDADVAAQVVALMRHRLKSQAGQALLAQAHVQARNAVRLLAA